MLDGLLANQTSIQPEMVSTDTAGASEIVFALAWALSYRRAPRLADLPDQPIDTQSAPFGAPPTDRTKGTVPVQNGGYSRGYRRLVDHAL